MKRIYQLAVLVALLIAPVAVSLPASAQAECNISNTGPGSENECSVEQHYTCEVSNNNQVTIKDSSGQVAASGNVEVDSNGSGGGAVSGSASNNNSSTFNVQITNGNTCVLAAAPTTETPETPVTPETPETPAPGKGETTAPVQPAEHVTPAALPVTSGNTAPVIFLSGSIVATVVVALLYRRLF